MVKLYKIKFLKDTELKKAGEIGEATKKNAEQFISQGYAEYVEEEKKKIFVRNIIPKQLQQPEFRFVLLKPKDKVPFEKDWQKNGYMFNDLRLTDHIEKGGNYGVIGGYGNLILIDADSEEINEVCKQLPDTFMVKTGGDAKHKHHYYFIADKEMNPIRLSKTKVGDLGDIRSTGQFVVAPNSTHPSGNKYKVINDIPIGKISEDFVKSIFKKYINLVNPTAEEKSKGNVYPIDTKKRLSLFIKNCNAPDYVLNNKLPSGVSKNWKLFPYVIDVLNARDVSANLYETLAETQGHDLGSVRGWVKSAKEGSLAKTSCKKMLDYLEHYTPDLVGEICGKCKLYKKTKEEKEKKELEENSKTKDKDIKKEKYLPSKRIEKLLQQRKLWDCIVDELNKKHVGDISAKEIIFLSALGRLVKNKKPYSFNVLVHSESSAGKDHLVESVLRLFPKEDIEAFGRISKTALTYFHDIKTEPLFTYDGKILYLEEITEDILNNEVMKVFTAGITKSLITKDRGAEVLEVNGKPVVICTTATTRPTPEILNRFSIVKLDESEEQTKRTYAHEEEDYNEEIIEYVSRLEPLEVNISSSMRKKIANVFPANKTSMRRTFPRFLDIIKAIAVFHKKKTVDWEDYDLAVRIFRNYRSGVSSIPLKHEDKKIVEILESSNDPLDAREITRSMEGVLTSSNIYKHLDNLKENGIIDCFDLRDTFNNQIKKYQISNEFKDKNPIELPDSSQLKK